MPLCFQERWSIRVSFLMKKLRAMTYSPDSSDPTPPETAPRNEHVQSLRKRILERQEEICQACDLRGVGPFPSTQAVAGQSQLPLIVEYSPLEEQECGLHPFEESPITCKNPTCQAYMNPYNEVVRVKEHTKMICCICQEENWLSSTYAQHLAQNPNSPERYNCCLEFVSPETEPCISSRVMLLLDVTREALESGALGTTVQGLCEWLARFDEDMPMRVGLITMAAHITVYELGREAPQRIVLMEDAGMSWAFHQVMTSKKSHIEHCLKDLERFVTDNPSSGCRLERALALSKELTRGNGGMICLFLVSEDHFKDPLLNQQVPKSKEVGNSFSISNHRLTNSLKEYLDYETTLSCFSFNRGYRGLVNLSEVIKQTNGWQAVYNLNEADQLTRAYFDIIFYLGGIKASQAVSQFRFSSTFKISSVYSPSNYSKTGNSSFTLRHFQLLSSNLTYLEFANIVAHPVPAFFVQTALTYLDSEGRRRLRICTKAVLTADSSKEVLSGMNASMYAGFYMKAAFSSLKSSLPANLITILTKKLTGLCRAMSMGSKEPPDMMGQLVVYFLGIFKHRLFKQQLVKGLPSQVSLGERSLMSRIGERDLIALVLPTLYSLDDIEQYCYQAEGQFVYPPPQQLTMADKEGGLYLLDIGNELILMIMRKEAGLKLFGPAYATKQPTEAMLHELDSDEGQRVIALVGQIRNCKPNWWCRLSFGIKQKMGPVEQRFFRAMLLDKHVQEFGGSYFDLYQKVTQQ